MHAGHVSAEQLAFFQVGLEGALAEYFYLADMDLSTAFRVQCCWSQEPAPPVVSGQLNPMQTRVPLAQEAESPQELESTLQPLELQPMQTESLQAPVPQAQQAQQAGPQAGQQAAVPGGEHAAAHAAVPGVEHAWTQGQRPRVLVPFGGGKDSTLLIQLLYNCGCEVQWVYYGEWLGSWDDYPKFKSLVAASPSKVVMLAEQHIPCLQRLKQLNLRPDIDFMDYVAVSRPGGGGGR